jgi:RHS repeat-associated protein
MGRLSEVRGSGATLVAAYAYDVQGCTSAAGAGGAGAANAQGQRARKVTPSRTVVYHYDLAGNLISETTATGAPIRDYVWQDATPLAQIEAGSPETLIFLHTDHLQTPRLATNSAGNAIWRWEGEAFGNTPPNEDVDGDGQATVINLRFPGQYADAETERHYNWNRHYDAAIGRYVGADPIGLAGGVNSYAYASNNALRFTDRFGLRPCPGGVWDQECGFGGSAGFGGGIILSDVSLRCRSTGLRCDALVFCIGGGVGGFVGAGVTLIGTVRGVDDSAGLNGWAWNLSTTIGPIGILGTFRGGGEVTIGKTIGFGFLVVNCRTYDVRCPSGDCQ